MPFTLSHPAAVLPLLRPPFVPVALVAGAMAPDVPYFLGTLGIPLSAGDWYEPFLNATTSHSPLGALTVSLPVTLALAAGWLLLRGPVTELLPRPAPHPASAPHPAPAPTAPAPPSPPRRQPPCPNRQPPCPWPSPRPARRFAASLMSSAVVGGCCCPR